MLLPILDSMRNKSMHKWTFGEWLFCILLWIGIIPGFIMAMILFTIAEFTAALIELVICLLCVTSMLYILSGEAH